MKALLIGLFLVSTTNIFAGNITLESGQKVTIEANSEMTISCSGNGNSSVSNAIVSFVFACTSENTIIPTRPQLVKMKILEDGSTKTVSVLKSYGSKDNWYSSDIDTCVEDALKANGIQ